MTRHSSIHSVNSTHSIPHAVMSPCANVHHAMGPVVQRHCTMILCVISMCYITAASHQVPSVFYVSATGADSNPGTLSAPFGSLQRCVNACTASPSPSPSPSPPTPPAPPAPTPPSPAPTPPSATCPNHCSSLGCMPGNGDACASCIAKNRKALQGECWAYPCPDTTCFSTFRNSYCYGKAKVATTDTVPENLAGAAVCTCVLRGGRYDGGKDGSGTGASTVTVQGTAGRPAAIAIEGFAGDAEPAVLDGSVSLDHLTWTADSRGSGTDSGCVFRSSSLPPDQPVPWQLWVQRQQQQQQQRQSSTLNASAPPPVSLNAVTDVTSALMPLTPARWPNALLSDLSVFALGGALNGSLAYTASNSSAAQGQFTDKGDMGALASLAESGLNATDTLAVLPLGTMGTHTRGWRVTSHEAGSSSFRTVPPGSATAGSGHANVPYFLEGHPKLLDAEQEWAWDSAARQLLMWPPGCSPPVGLRGRVQTYALNSSFASVSMRRLTLFGATVASSNTALEFDTVQWLFPTASRRALGDGSATLPTITDGNRGTLTVRNSTIAWDDPVSAPFSPVGNGAVFENNLWHANGYAGGSSATMEGDHAQATGMRFLRNTVQHFNAFTGITPGFLANVSLNLFQKQGPPVDGAGVHVHIGPQNGILIDRNWALDLGVKAFRFDRVNTASATWGENGTVTRNVAQHTAGVMVKGDKHTVRFNTELDTNEPNAVPAMAKAGVVPPRQNPGLTLMMYDATKSWSKKGENAHSIFEHCTSDWIFNVSGVLPGNGGLANGTNATSSASDVGGTPIGKELVDPAGLDFRARPTSWVALAGAGAYGDTNGGATEYWVPGQQLARPSQPIGATSLRQHNTRPMLAWRGAYGAIAYQVHIGLDRAAVVNAAVQLDDATFALGNGTQIPVLASAPQYASALITGHGLSDGPPTSWQLRGADNNVGASPFLGPDETLFWRVDSLHRDGSVAGYVWSF